MPYANITHDVPVSLSIPIAEDGRLDANAAVDIPPLDMQDIVTAAIAQLRGDASAGSTSASASVPTPARVPASDSVIDVSVGPAASPALSLSLPPVSAASPLPEHPSAFAVPLSTLASTMASMAPAVAAYAHEVHSEANITDMASVAILRTHSRAFGTIFRRLGTALIDLGSALNHIDWGEPELVTGNTLGAAPPAAAGVSSIPDADAADAAAAAARPTAVVRGNTIVSPPAGVVDDGSTVSRGVLVTEAPAPAADAASASTSTSTATRGPARLTGPTQLHQSAPQLNIASMLAGMGGPQGQAMGMGMGDMGMGDIAEQLRNFGHLPLGAATRPPHNTAAAAAEAQPDAAPAPAEEEVIDIPDREANTDANAETSSGSSSGSRRGGRARRGGRGARGDPLASLMGMLGGASRGSGAASGGASTGASASSSASSANPMSGLMGMLGGLMQGGQGQQGGQGGNPLAGLGGMMSSLMQQLGDMNDDDEDTTAADGSSSESSDASESGPSSFPAMLVTKLLANGPMELVGIATSGNWAGVDKMYPVYHTDLNTRLEAFPAGRDVYPPFISAPQGAQLTQLTDSAVDDTLGLIFDGAVLAAADAQHPSGALQWAPAVLEASPLPATLAQARTGRHAARFRDMSEDEYLMERRISGATNLVGGHISHYWGYLVALIAFGPRNVDNAAAGSRHPAIAREDVDAFMMERINAPAFAANIDHTAAATAKGFGTHASEMLISLCGGALDILTSKVFSDGEPSVTALTKALFASVSQSPELGEARMLVGMVSGMLGSVVNKALTKYRERQAAREGESQDPAWMRALNADERAQWVRMLEQDSEAQTDIQGYFFE
jgi:hypothetical protein